MFYNERNDVPYPEGYQNASVIMELCEVIVYGKDDIISEIVFVFYKDFLSHENFLFLKPCGYPV